MSDPTIHVYRKNPLEKWPTYIGYCCREWPLAIGMPVGRCGICGERPTYLRDDKPKDDA
jgi:hypothetical protein